jgi:hypothetical protein
VANKISVIIDATTDKAVSSLKSFRTSINEADGAAGKMKAGFAGATTAIKANAGALAATAGASLIAFGVKAVGAFTETALAAGKFSDATGIAVDDASRWMEVGGDVGIGADAIQGAIQKMNKALADGKPAFEQYGVEVVRTSDGLVDANATFQNALTTIGKIPDPTKRAQAAQQVFGKSYAEVARLMEMSAGDLEAALRGVSDSKVIDESELKKAREFQAAMDTLRDSVEDVALKVGERLTPLVTGLAKALDALDKGASEVSDSPLGFVLDGWGDIFDSAQYRAHELADGLGLVDDITVEFEGDLKAAQAAQKAFSGETVSTTENLRTYSDAAETAAMETREAERQASRLAATMKRLDDEAAALDIEQAFVDLRVAAEEAFTATATGADDAAQKQRDYQGALIETKQRVAEYATEVLGLPAERVTGIVARLDEGNLAAIESQLYWLARGRTVRISGQLVGADLRNAVEGRVPMGATGGIVTRPTLAMIGEAGPEAVVPLNRTPGSSPLGGMGGNTTVNIYTNADPNSTKAALRRFDRRNGPGL